jgi:ELWxxDGT repeat protein
MVMDIYPGDDWESSMPEGLTEYKGKTYFMADDGVHGYELWSTDGDTALLAADINLELGEGSYPENSFKVFNNKLYFRANDGVNGSELWSFDGVSAKLEADINPNGDSSPHELTEYKGRLYFSANRQGVGNELWSYDGSSLTLIGDINIGASSSLPHEFKVYNNNLPLQTNDEKH